MHIASDQLLLSTRFLPAVVIKDDLMYATSTNPVRLTTSRLTATSRAITPEPGDCGRGAIIALDCRRTLRSSAVTQIGADEFTCQGLPDLRRFISGIYWAEEAIPIMATHGSRAEIWSCEEWDERLADVRETLEMNGVPAHDMEPLDDLWDWGACSYNSDNGGLVLGVDLHLLVTPPSLMATAVPRTSGAQRRRC